MTIKYSIQSDDLTHALAYLERLIQIQGIDFADPQAARTAFQKATEVTGKVIRATALTEWATAHLDHQGWLRLKQVVRKRRERRKKGENIGKTVLLSIRAHRLLKRLADRDSVTLSEALESYLPKILNAKPSRR